MTARTKFYRRDSEISAGKILPRVLPRFLNLGGHNPAEISRNLGGQNPAAMSRNVGGQNPAEMSRNLGG